MTDIKTGKQTIEMGALYMTATIAQVVQNNQRFSRFVNGSIGRHRYRDFGDTKHHDTEVNNDALVNGGRIISVYNLPDHIRISGQSRIWIITEANRQYTTVIFPSDY